MEHFDECANTSGFQNLAAVKLFFIVSIRLYCVVGSIIIKLLRYLDSLNWDIFIKLSLDLFEVDLISKVMNIIMKLPSLDYVICITAYSMEETDYSSHWYNFGLESHRTTLMGKFISATFVVRMKTTNQC